MLNKHGPFTLVLIIYILINLSYNVASPIFEPPDEATHYRYVKYLLDYRTLPTLIDGPNRQELWGLHQPPLYFMISAILASPFEQISPTDYLQRNPHVNLGFAQKPGNKNYFIHTEAEAFPFTGFPLLIHYLRLFSLVCGGLTLVFVYLIGLTLFDGRPTTAALAPAFMALHPEFVFINAEIANEPLNILLMAAGIWGCTRLIIQGPSRRLAVFVGCTAGLIAIAKMTGLALFLLIAIAMLIAALQKQSAPKLWEFGLIVGLVAALLGGWWYVRNWQVYGDPWQASMYLDFYKAPQRVLAVGEWVGGILAGEVSFWATFGWLNILAPEWVYTFYKAVLRLGVLGLVVYFARTYFKQNGMLPKPPMLPVVLFLITSPLVSSLILTRLLATETGIQGRQLLPILPALALLLTVGYRALLPKIIFRPATAVLGLAMFGLTAAMPFWLIAPAYRPPPYLAETALPADMVRLNRRYDDKIELLGYRLDSDLVRPGQVTALTLYWRALQPLEQNYTVFVHALGQQLTKVAEYNGFPGQGNFATNMWPVGQIIEDRYEFQVDPAAETPTLLRLHVGLFDHTRLDLPPLTTVDQASNVVSPLVAQQVLQGERTVATNADCIGLAVNFADQIQLDCFALEQSFEQAILTLFWQVDEPPQQDYTVFIQLWQQNRQLGGFDGPPFSGDFPTSYWKPNQTLEDDHILRTSQLEPGSYRLLIGLYNAETGERLPAFDAQGAPLRDFAVDLGEFVVGE